MKHSCSESRFGSEKPQNHHLIVGSAATEFPRPASSFLLHEQDSFDTEVDFSVEKEILKRQLHEIKQAKAEERLNGQMHHENSSTSVFDEDDEDEIKIVRALKEIDSNENPKKE
jgi:hypothetical protein